jgi:hypothetical protein
MHWRDQVTAALRESVAVAGQSRRETYAYHSTSGTGHYGRMRLDGRRLIL